MVNHPLIRAFYVLIGNQWWMCDWSSSIVVHMIWFCNSTNKCWPLPPSLLGYTYLWPLCGINFWSPKVQLLEALNSHTIGNLEEAGRLYIDSINSAREHKFIHEEAVASELTGDCLFELGRQSEAYTLYKHSIKCFEEWGANAVAKRVETDMQSKFGADVSHLEAVDVSDILSTSSLDPQSTQKRNHTGEDWLVWIQKFNELALLYCIITTSTQ